jgi:peptidoglycan-N-acetylglucosamine deacetylase
VTRKLFRVALSIDAEHPDRPCEPGGAARVLDALSGAGVRATFFVQGRWAEAEPAVAARIARDGHLVGNHSHHHARLPLLTAAGLAEDVRASEAAIRAIVGVDPRPWFRCPFGSGAGSAKLIDRLAELGYVDVGWDADALDWDGPPPGTLRSRVVRGVIEHGDGAVLLLHSWPDPTSEALPGILGDLLTAGATFVTLDALDIVPGRRSPLPVAAA